MKNKPFYTKNVQVEIKSSVSLVFRDQHCMVLKWEVSMRFPPQARDVLVHMAAGTNQQVLPERTKVKHTSKVSCSKGLNISVCSLLTSLANTTSAGASESIQLALIEMTACPPFLRKWCALIATIRAWSGCATSAKMTSTSDSSMRYFWG
jgi:hypothetical protein